MLRDVFDIYNRNTIKILILSLLLLIPLNYVLQFIIMYLFSNDSIAYPGIITLCLLCIQFMILFPPFSLLTIEDMKEEESSIKELFASFYNNFAFLILLTILIFSISLFGSICLLPVLIGSGFILILPIYCHSNKLQSSIANTWEVMKRENIALVGDIVLIVSILTVFWWVVLFFIGKYENTFFVYITIRVLVDTLIFPIIYIYLTRKYWSSISSEKEYVV